MGVCAPTYWCHSCWVATETTAKNSLTAIKSLTKRRGRHNDITSVTVELEALLRPVVQVMWLLKVSRLNAWLIIAKFWSASTCPARNVGYLQHVESQLQTTKHANMLPTHLGKKRQSDRCGSQQTSSSRKDGWHEGSGNPDHERHLWKGETQVSWYKRIRIRRAFWPPQPFTVSFWSEE